MRCHEIDYTVYGEDLQYVEIELDPKETVIAEAGMMMYMDDGIGVEAKMGDGSNPTQGFMSKLVSAGSRILAQESIFLTHFTNNISGKKRVAFAAPYPGKIIPVDLKKTMGEIICQRDAFLCAALGTKLEIEFTKNIGAGFFGGEGFILQRLRGDGLAFVHACGGIRMEKLNGGKLCVDPGCIVAFTRGIDYSIERSGNLKSMLFGGEGLFLATLKGTGYVWIQSLPFSRLANQVIKNSSIGGGKKGENKISLGSLGSLLDL